MKLNRTGSNWNRLERNKINENWDIIEGSHNKLEDEFDDVVGKITDEVVGHLIDSAKLIWKEPVDTVDDLPANAEVGETRMVREADPEGISYVYRYDGEKWEKIQAIDVTLVNEVDSRLTRQLAETTSNIHDLKGWELNSKGRKKKGVVVFISDDAKRGDWDIFKPIFESENVPLGFAIISDEANSGYPIDAFMTEEEKLYLQNVLGWEAMSHSKTHTNPPITDMTDEEAEEQYAGSKRDLEARGFKIQSYMVPGGRFNARERLLGRKYYRAARISSQGLNYLPIETHELKVIWIGDRHEHVTLNDYKAYIDEAVEKGALCIFGLHGDDAESTETQDKLREVIRYAKSKTDVMNLRDALDIVGNIVEVGDYTKNTGVGKESQSDYFVVGADGVIESSSNLVYTDYTKINFNTDPKKLPKGVSYSKIPLSQAEYAPSKRPGFIKTDNPTDDINFIQQEYHVYQSNDIYVRYVDRDTGEYSRWIEKSFVMLSKDNAYTLNFRPSSIPTGITFIRVPASFANISPSKTPGMLISYNVDDDVRFNHQKFVEFQGRRSYIRHALDDLNWGEWKLVDATILTNENNLLLNASITDFDFGVTYSKITTAYAGESPSGTAGLLITYRTCIDDDRFNYQEFKPFQSSVIYRRHVKSDFTFSAWVEK